MSYHCSTSPVDYNKCTVVLPISALPCVSMLAYLALTPLIVSTYEWLPSFMSPHRTGGWRTPGADGQNEVNEPMQNRKTRLTVITGATLALVMAGTAVASAHPGHDRDQRQGFDPGTRIQRGMGERMPGMFEKGMARMGDRGDFRSAIREHIDQFVRSETTFESEDGLVTRRIDNGTVEVTDDTGLSYSLANGETATVTIDDDTHIVAFDEETVERGRWSRERLVPSEVELAEVEAGAEITVWSDSEDGADFLAQRIVIRPAVDEEAADATEAEATEAEPADEAAATDA